MGKNHREPIGRRLDRLLFTRPLFETLLFENEFGSKDRAVVIAHTLLAVARYRWRQIASIAGEATDIVIFRAIAGGRVPRRGMTAILETGDCTWYQVKDWSVAQRVRRTFGRVHRRDDCTALHCGWRHEVTRGDPLPVFVLLDASSRVLEVVYADVGDDGIESLMPGTEPNLRPTPECLVPALRALASRLGSVDFEDRLQWFTGTQT